MATTDYYNILKVNRNATTTDLKKAYHRLAMIHHPDRNSNSNKSHSESKFKQIQQAYDVLIDPHKRHIYDTSHTNNSNSNKDDDRDKKDRESGFRYKGRDAEEIYEEVVGKKAPAVEKVVMCGLGELCRGVDKKMKISRTVVSASGQIRTVEEILTIEIKPGWKKGTKVTFPEKGNQEPGIIAADLIFIIDEKPHEVFTREGNDLIINQEIPLIEALTGKTIDLTTLDGRNLLIPVTEIVKPGYELIVPNEGMPISKEPRKKGNLIIKFDVRYPKRLTSEQKSDLKRVLGRNM
ncbi:chaperone DnaJ [Artemisia annua]|uniref:Chaperone DnaJ n=1 Tax=Artemisia annua TaxID=35608 RepID=A0A2U1M5M6_ARTAN|nr:chaperone DnaJ [Artemisia annua]